MDEYFEEKNYVTNLLNNSLKNKTYVQSYMFSSNNIDDALKLAIQFSKALITLDMDEELKKNIIYKIDKNEYEELLLIQPTNNQIKKEEINKIKKFISTKPILGSKKIYIVKNCEKLNQTSANSMLKFVEEANDDVIALFLTDNIDLVISTIKSRCQILNLITIDEKDICNIINDLNPNLENVDNFIKNTIQIINYIEKNGINTFYNLKTYFYDNFTNMDEIKLLLKIILYFYYDIFNINTLKKIKYFYKYKEEINKYINYDINKIIKKIIIVEKIINDSKYNLNQKLIFDRLILELCEV